MNNAKNTIVEDDSKSCCCICTGSLGLPVTCAKCDGKSCYLCFQTYLLNSTLTPTCMHCKTSLSDDFVLDNTKSTWRSTKYKVYRENLLFDIERARLPETQPYAVIYSNATKILEPVIERINKRKELIKANMILTNEEWKKSVNIYSARLKELYKERIAIKRSGRPDNRLRRLYAPIVLTFGKAQGAEVAAAATSCKRAIVKACPKADCKGFLDEEFKCPMCTSCVCKKCHEIIDGLHLCNPDTVETIKAIKAEARACPSCGTLISKIDGCDQMWCTQCHVTFSWRTGLVEKGITHNPHYYEWMRKNGGMPRQAGDLPQCEGYPGLGVFIGAFPPEDIIIVRNLDRLNRHDEANDRQRVIYILLEYHRLVAHMYAMNVTNQVLAVPDNHDLRVMNLAKIIDDAKTKIALQKRDKAYRKQLAKQQVYTMAYTVAGDIFRGFLHDLDMNLCSNSIEKLFVYTNECLQRITDKYNCVTERFKIYVLPDFPKGRRLQRYY